MADETETMGSGASGEPGLFNQVIILGVRDFGAGALGDAVDYGDRGSNTLSHVSAYMGGVELPILQWLGLGNVTAVRGVERAEPAAASVGRLARRGEGTDAAGALKEAVGALLEGIASADEGGPPVHLVGAAAALLGDGLGEDHPLPPSSDLADVLSQLVHRVPRGIIVAVEPVGGTDKAGPVGIARAWSRLDGHLGRLLDHQPEDSLLLVFSLSGNDATIAARRGQTREFSPVLAYTPALPSGVDLGEPRALADLGATVAEIMGCQGGGGASFFGRLIA